MTETEPKNNSDKSEIAQIMQRVASVANTAELDELRFIECQFSLREYESDHEEEARIDIGEYSIDISADRIISRFRFGFHAPSPIESDSAGQVHVTATLQVEYQLSESSEIPEGDAKLFGKVNGLYNAWPFLREYLHSSLTRLNLPPFNLPLLQAGSAAMLAGVISKDKEED